MTYELAKKLKDAGFPQDGSNKDANGDSILVHEMLTEDEIDSRRNGAGLFFRDSAYIPTLSELIEASGQTFDNLTMRVEYLNGEYSTKWVTNFLRGCACGDCNIPSSDTWKTSGSTPEEAVANLYLALKA